MKKIFFDFFPIILFFIFFKIYDIYYATGILMIAFVLQVTYELVRYKKVDPMHIMTLVLVLVFGGLTIYFHNDLFIQWKVTAINCLFV
jgi:intracellular septation protein